jgi:hypothetical protein
VQVGDFVLNVSYVLGKCVGEDHVTWHYNWYVRKLDYKILDTGVAPTRLKAQAAAEEAMERIKT